MTAPQAPQEDFDAYEALLTARAAAWGGPGPVSGEIRTAVTAIEGLRALRQLREVLDELEPQLVAKARERRNPHAAWWPDRQRPVATWEEIAAALGVPKNTLHRRYGPGSG